MTISDRAQELAVAAAEAASEKLADDILAFDVGDQLVITDCFVLCSAPNDRQVKAIVDAVEERLRTLGAKPVRREGEREGRWVLLDYIDVIVHVQHAEERVYYSLERIWKDCPGVELPEHVRAPRSRVPADARRRRTYDRRGVLTVAPGRERPPARRVVLWRHGQTAWNLEDRFQGHTDVELDAVGRDQAARAAAAARRPQAARHRVVRPAPGHGPRPRRWPGWPTCRCARTRGCGRPSAAPGRGSRSTRSGALDADAYAALAGRRGRAGRWGGVAHRRRRAGRSGRARRGRAGPGGGVRGGRDARRLGAGGDRHACSTCRWTAGR